MQVEAAIEAVGESAEAMRGVLAILEGVVRACQRRLEVGMANGPPCGDVDAAHSIAP